jgi:hypothetical protein
VLSARLQEKTNQNILSSPREVVEPKIRQKNTSALPARTVRIQNLTERVFSAKKQVNYLIGKDPDEIMNKNH